MLFFPSTIYEISTIRHSAQSKTKNLYYTRTPEYIDKMILVGWLVGCTPWCVCGMKKREMKCCYTKFINMKVD